MILSVAYFRHLISGVVLDDASIEIKKNFSYKMDYEASLFKSHLTTKKIQAFLETKPILKEYVSDLDCKKRFIDLEDTETLNAITQRAPLSLLVLNHFDKDGIKNLKGSERNICMNADEYGLDIPVEIKIKLDEILVPKLLGYELSKLIDVNEVMVSTFGVKAVDRERYIKSIIETFASTVKISGLWKFTLDDDLQMIPLIAGLSEVNTDLTEYFKSHELPSHAKLIIAPGVTTIEMTREKGETEKITLTVDKLNKIDLKADEKAAFKWKSSKSKFNAEIYGSHTDLFIDTRPRLL